MTLMQREAFAAFAGQPEELEKSIEYLCRHMARFVRRQERVLLCFANRGQASMGGLLEQALRRLEAIPLFWGPDYRWKALLKQAFFSRATAIIGTPLIVLGLAKMAKATETPLYIRNVLLAGYPCREWMLEGIQRGLDCRIWGCYIPDAGSVVAGFSCAGSRGIHLRQEAYRAEIVDEAGQPLPDGERGRIVLIPTGAPELRYDTGETGIICMEGCVCGSEEPRILKLGSAADADPVMLSLEETLLSWSSVLDYQAARTDSGLELEVVRFKGEQLPKLPTCARLNVRPWDPERDMPFCLKNPRK